MKEFKIGEEVWYFDQYEVLRHGIITDIGDGYAKTKEGQHGGASAGAKLEHCYATKEECCKVKVEADEARKLKYRESVKTVEDLVKFLWTHDIHSEYPDYEARDIAAEKAKEFGIKLD